jgi:hypothetical protein
VFEEEIQDFPGFCEEKQKLDTKSMQRPRLVHVTTRPHSPDVVDPEQAARPRSPRPGNFIKF